MIYKFIHSIEVPKPKELGEGIICKTIKANNLYDACKLCFLDMFSTKYRLAFAEKVKNTIPETQNFDELKEAYLKLNFHLETVTVEKNI